MSKRSPAFPHFFSGTGADGSLGSKVIKGNDGLVQDELSAGYNGNLLISTEIATTLIGSDLCIRRFTYQATGAIIKPHLI